MKKNLTLRVLDYEGNEIHKMCGEIDLNGLYVKIHSQTESSGLTIIDCNALYSMIHQRLIFKIEESPNLRGEYDIVTEVRNK